jgi:hypothetical protein
MGSGCIAMRLYLPEEWTRSLNRCKAAGIPSQVRTQKKWQSNRRKDQLLALSWPGTMRITVESFTDGPPETAAVTYFAPTVAKRSGTTEDAIRAVLDTLDGVIL